MTTVGRAERPWPARHPGGRITPQGRASDGVVAMARRKWSELSNRQRALIMGGGAVQVTLQAVALFGRGTAGGQVRWWCRRPRTR